MFEYLKSVINDSSTQEPSSKRFVLVVSSLTLCFGFITSFILLAFGFSIPESLIVGLAAIIAGLAGGSYSYTKAKEIQGRKE